MNLKDDLKENWKPYLTILIVAILIWTSLILSICDSADAQTLEYRDTLLTFTSTKNLQVQITEIETCDTVQVAVGQRWTYHYDLTGELDFIDYDPEAEETVITCREIVWVTYIPPRRDVIYYDDPPIKFLVRIREVKR